MKVVLFFVCLCFLLLKQDTTAYAGMQQRSASGNLIHAAGVNIAATDRKEFVSAAPSIRPGMEYLIGDDVEEEEPNDCAAPKDKLPARNHVLIHFLRYPAVLAYSWKCLKVPPFFFRPVSDRYILQRVLRL